jgi:hypothetical protein
LSFHLAHEHTNKDNRERDDNAGESEARIDKDKKERREDVVVEDTFLICNRKAEI